MARMLKCIDPVQREPTKAYFEENFKLVLVIPLRHRKRKGKKRTTKRKNLSTHTQSLGSRGICRMASYVLNLLRKMSYD